MKKGINKEYDELRDKLIDLRTKMTLIIHDSSKSEKYNNYVVEVNYCLDQMKKLEMESIKKK